MQVQQILDAMPASNFKPDDDQAEEGNEEFTYRYKHLCMHVYSNPCVYKCVYAICTCRYACVYIYIHHIYIYIYIYHDLKVLCHDTNGHDTFKPQR